MISLIIRYLKNPLKKANNYNLRKWIYNLDM